MKKACVLILILGLLLVGCAPAATVQSRQDAVNSLPQGSSEQMPREDQGAGNIQHFVLQEDSLTVPVEGVSPIAAVAYDSHESPEAYQIRVDQAIANQGVLPGYGELKLSIRGQMPTKISWYVQDGISTPKDSGSMTVNSRMVTIPLYDSADSALSSSLLGTGPQREVRIICQYPTGQVEFLMVLDPIG